VTFKAQGFKSRGGGPPPNEDDYNRWMTQSWVPPFLVSFVVVFIYTVFCYLHLLPQWSYLRGSPRDSLSDPNVRPGSHSEVLGVTVSFHVFFLLFILSYVRSMITDAGSIPVIGRRDRKKWENGNFKISPQDDARVRKMITQIKFKLEAPDIDFLRGLPVVERKQKNGQHRFCAECGLFKPDRCHHCSVCGQCILRMDHHCPWISNCVGFHNYKFFLLLLLYGILCSGMVLVTMFPRFLKVFKPILDVSTFLRVDIPVTIAMVISLFVCTALGMFFCFHIYLTVNALTTIEFREKKNNEDKFVKHRWRIAHVKYDIGPLTNFNHIFGPLYMWLLPLRPPYSHKVDGTYSTHPLRARDPNEQESDTESDLEDHDDLDHAPRHAAETRGQRQP